ncbi:hypothetical protein LZZ85_11365 [Terrimonas sp. NA20]|uniref:Uncharacterized protein n=1 Tax=Terrimonas ginsenosidimutans TaxID=2908004 RepID=A0ABS9KRD1_9BACT|nr:hypothetical protein [Terrimonas ginsenosidimutans]MCG2614887.1 hypothetical protein [Terrimonas ginsenosidimutans]
MAKVAFDLIQKPIEQRIIDAASIYWGVDRSEFFKKFDREITYQRSLIYYLIKTNTEFGYRIIGTLFEVKSHQNILRLVENVECTKDTLPQIKRDLNQIMNIANMLDASSVVYEIELVNNKLKIQKA